MLTMNQSVVAFLYSLSIHVHCNCRTTTKISFSFLCSKTAIVCHWKSRLPNVEESLCFIVKHSRKRAREKKKTAGGKIRGLDLFQHKYTLFEKACLTEQWAVCFWLKVQKQFESGFKRKRWSYEWHNYLIAKRRWRRVVCVNLML